ncbi:unnamed protein product, partial [marine sediment metagenome]
MSSDEQIVFDGSKDGGLPPYQPPCAERRLPDGRSFWIHGYTLADTAAWKQAARMMEGVIPPDEASPHTQRLAQVVFVCRTGPDADRRLFVVRQGGEAQVRDHLAKHLPGRFLDAVCAESDGLALQGYLPPEKSSNPMVEE